MILKIYDNELEESWTHLEEHPIKMIKNGYCEPCVKGKETFWSVFAHQKSGGLACIADVESESDATRLIAFLTKLYESKVD